MRLKKGKGYGIDVVSGEVFESVGENEYIKKGKLKVENPTKRWYLMKEKTEDIVILVIFAIVFFVGFALVIEFG